MVTVTQSENAVTTAALLYDPLDIASDLVERRKKRLAVADAAAQVQWYGQALDFYLGIAFRDMLGSYGTLRDERFQTIGYGFNRVLAYAAPGVLQRVAKCANSLGLTTDELKERFGRVAAAEAKQIAHLGPLCSPEDIWDRLEGPLLRWLASGTRWPHSTQMREPAHGPDADQSRALMAMRA